jgi:RNA polymerase sigma-70 factor (ECF subfamily)
VTSPRSNPSDTVVSSTAPATDAGTPSGSTVAAQQQVTQLLEAVQAGRASAADQLLPLVYDELRALAGSLFRGQRPDHTLQPTALVHEAYARMVKPAAETTGSSEKAQWNSRAHFFAVAATAMRQVLANHARDRRRAKRGGGWHRVTLSEHLTPTSERDVDLLALDEALQALAKLDERQGRIVELRFFAEMSVEEIAHVLEVSTSTVEREWRMARAWLSARLRASEEESA